MKSSLCDKRAVPTEPRIDLFQMQDLCVEFLTDPFAHLLKVFMRRVEKDIDKIGIPGGATTIFRRATAGSIQHAGIVYSRLG